MRRRWSNEETGKRRRRQRGAKARKREELEGQGQRALPRPVRAPDTAADSPLRRRCRAGGPPDCHDRHFHLERRDLDFDLRLKKKKKKNDTVNDIYTKVYSVELKKVIKLLTYDTVKIFFGCLCVEHLLHIAGGLRAARSEEWHQT
jgi:hypothetical protein